VPEDLPVYVIYGVCLAMSCFVIFGHVSLAVNILNAAAVAESITR